LKHYQDPEWSAWILEQAAEDTLAKTRQYNADADVWRLLRPEDLGVATLPVGGVVNKNYYQAVALPAAVATVVIRFRVPAGIGITFMGMWISGYAGVGDLGMGDVYEVDVNTVKRQEIPLKGEKTRIHAVDVRQAGAFLDIWQRSIALEQFVFVRQNDLVEIAFFCKHGYTGQIEFWPIAVIAGNRKQLLVAE
jgi:hypothetical protein